MNAPAPIVATGAIWIAEAAARLPGVVKAALRGSSNSELPKVVRHDGHEHAGRESGGLPQSV
jgi:hypothetical protein